MADKGVDWKQSFYINLRPLFVDDSFKGIVISTLHTSVIVPLLLIELICGIGSIKAVDTFIVVFWQVVVKFTG